MKLIFLLLAVLLTPFLVLTGLDSAGIWMSDPLWRGRIALAILLVVTGSAHYWAAGPMTRMFPPVVPCKKAIVYLTGVPECLAAAALFTSRCVHLTGWCLILFLIAVYPVNIYAAVKRIDLADQGRGPAYLLIRTPVQFFLIGWCWWFAARTA